MTGHEDALRAWAKGIYPLEAATELLVRTGFAGPTRPWVHVEDDRAWIDFAALPDLAGAMSGGEQRLLGIAASLGSERAAINLADSLAGLDRDWVELVLAAVSHAAGTHEGVVLVPADDDAVRFSPGGPLHPWPAT